MPDDWSFRCCECTAVAMAAAPGDEPVYAPGGILIDPGKPSVAWCSKHWPALRGFQADLFTSVTPV